MKAHFREIIAGLLMGETEGKAPGITAVYLFGSCATGESTGSSDVDLAFLFEEKFYRTDPLEAFSDATLIAAKLSSELNKKTDVVVLNSASLELAYEVISTGTCIYEADPDLRVTYEAKTIGLWFDFKPFIEQLRKEALAGL